MSPEAATPIRIAFLTGRSDPSRCGLSPEQQGFLDALRAPGREPVDRNFPYAAQRPGHVAVPLPLAAWRNLGDYIGARRPAFAGRHRSQVAAAFEGDGAVVLLAGSCGLELLSNLHLDASLRARLHVFAYGPVARHAPDVARLLCVQGRSDWISRAGWGGPVHRVDGGHMDYLRQPDVLTLCEDFIAGTPCAST